MKALQGQSKTGLIKVISNICNQFNQLQLNYFVSTDYAYEEVFHISFITLVWGHIKVFRNFVEQ